jgi:hypothetical protein
MSEMRRKGDVEKCPACGWGLAASAYRCPKCNIFFCYKCRVRVGINDKQYQCADQSCGCYGKLVCNACVVDVSTCESKTLNLETIHQDATKWALYIGGAVFFAAFAIPTSIVTIGGAALSGVAAAGVACGLYDVKGYNTFGRKDKKTLNTYKVNETHTHISCVQCRHPVKDMTR